MKKAILLINLGTPDSCDAKSVKKYLREFLNDPRVVDLPKIIRWPLVNLRIIPSRYKNTLSLYEKIWTDEGSPLLNISTQIKEKLAEKLGDEYHVELGMRYGNPSIESAFEKIRNSESITVIPLFPQYSSAATGSAVDEFLSTFSSQWNIPGLSIKQDFYNDSGFIAAVTEVIKNNLADKMIDKLIFSYHGLPERHITKSNCRAACDHIHACPAVTTANRFCYRAQCYETSALVAESLGLSADDYVVSFQSRLGRTPWIKPYTDLLLPELIQQGVQNIAMVSPSFVADCLETLEEINIRLRKQWQEIGGKEFTFIPCVNGNEIFIDALSQWSLHV